MVARDPGPLRRRRAHLQAALAVLAARRVPACSARARAQRRRDLRANHRGGRPLRYGGRKAAAGILGGPARRARGPVARAVPGGEEPQFANTDRGLARSPWLAPGEADREDRTTGHRRRAARDVARNLPRIHRAGRALHPRPPARPAGERQAVLDQQRPPRRPYPPRGDPHPHPPPPPPTPTAPTSASPPTPKR